MANRLNKVPVAVYTPAVQAIAARPAYCELQQALVGYTGGTAGLSWQPVTHPDGSTGYAQLPTYDPSGPDVQVTSYSPLRPSYKTVEICYPAVRGVEGRPARVDYYANAGWNSGAISVNPVPAFSAFKARVKVLAAAMVGLADRGFDHSYGYMSFAFAVRPTGYTVVERGVDKTAEAALAAGAVLELQRRLNGSVVYLVDGVEVYTSAATSAGELYGAALLYSLGDEAYDPQISTIAAYTTVSFSAELPAARALISDTALAYMSAELPRIYLDARLSPRVKGIDFTATLPAMRALISDRDVAVFQGEIPAIQFGASLVRPEAVVSSMTALIPPPALSALLLSGQAISFSASLPSMRALISDRDIAFMRAEAPMRLRLLAGEPYLLPGYIDGSESLLAADPAVLEAAILLVGIDSLEVGGYASITLVLELFGMDSLAVGDSTSLGQLVEMLAMEQVAINSNGATARQQALQYAINAASGAPTKYSGFDFHSFVNVDGQAYGLKADGLYRIGDEASSSELINALVDFGTSEFGVTQTKRVNSALLGVRTDGECYLRIAADDGPESVYRLEGLGNMKRAKLAKGVDGRYWSTRLELTDLSFAKVDSIELEVGVSQRHSFGRRK